MLRTICPRVRRYTNSWTSEHAYIHIYLPTYLPTHSSIHLSTYLPSYLATYLPRCSLVYERRCRPSVVYATKKRQEEKRREKKGKEERRRGRAGESLGRSRSAGQSEATRHWRHLVARTQLSDGYAPPSTLYRLFLFDRFFLFSSKIFPSRPVHSIPRAILLPSWTENDRTIANRENRVTTRTRIFASLIRHGCV